MDSVRKVGQSSRWKQGLHRSLPFVLVALFSGCAGRHPEVDFSQGIDPSQLRGLRESIHPNVGEWRQTELGFTNFIPPEVGPQDVMRATGGAGVSLGVADGFSARDLTLSARMSFEGTGAPCLVFRVTEEAGVIGSMYSVAVFSSGLNLGCLTPKGWRLIEHVSVPVPPYVPHDVVVTVKGDRIRAELDRQQVLDVRERTLTKPGGAGICGREGPCFFRSLQLRGLD